MTDKRVPRADATPAPISGSIRSRALWAFGVFSVIQLGIVGAVSTLTLLETEDRVFAGQLQDQLNRTLETGVDPTGRFAAYWGHEALPPHLRQLELWSGSDLAPTEVQEGQLYEGSPGLFVAVRHFETQLTERSSPLVMTFDIERLEWQPQFARRLVMYLVAVGVLSTLLTLGLGRFTIDFVLRPIDALRRAVEAQDEHGGPLELRLSEQPRETRPLVAALQDAFDRISRFAAREHRFTRNVSHELRTPLTVFGSGLELAGEHLLEGHGRRVYERMRRSLSAMVETVDVLTWLARESSSRPGNDEDVAVTEVVDELIGVDGAVNLHSELELHNELPAALTVRAPRKLLEIVLSNLLRNAAQNTREGSIVISGSRRAITIEDSGIGMSSEQKRLATELGRSWRDGGTGIGLALLQDIADRLGWTLELSDANLGGTRAQLSFQR